MNNIRQIPNALIYKDDKLLVVDKKKEDGKILTILPGGKIENGENIIGALNREIEEELGIHNIKIISVLGIVSGNSPTSNIKTNIHLFKINIYNSKIKTEDEVQNARYLTYNEILDLPTTTELTKKIVNYLINQD